MAPPRRPAAAPPAPVGVNFGGNEMYVAGGGISEGNYALTFDVQMYQATKNNVPTGAPRLGIMLTAYPLADGALVAGAEPKTKFLSMGSQADKSFAPDPTTGKGLVAIPGAQGATLPDSTNWNIFRKSLYDSGLPEGIFSNDLTPLDGLWAHLSNVPEPEERKGFGAGKAQTGEVQVEEQRKNQTTVIVSEILEGGAPWEGGGGFPEVAAAPVAPPKAGPKGVVRPPARPPVAAPAAAPAAEAGDEDMQTAAVNGVASVLEANPKGMPKLALKTNTFKAVSAAAGAEMAQAVINSYFDSDANLGVLVGGLGFKVAGVQVIPA